MHHRQRLVRLLYLMDIIRRILLKESVDSVFQWCSTTIEFFLKKEPDFVFMKDLKEIVLSLKERKNIKGLKSIKKELESEFVVELSVLDYSELEILLNHSHQQLKLDISSEVKNVIERGYIFSDDEYTMLSNNVGSSDGDNIEMINEMLIDYYKNKKLGRSEPF